MRTQEYRNCAIIFVEDAQLHTKHWNNGWLMLQTVKKILQKNVNKVKEQSEIFGLFMNVSKTKTMRVNKEGEERNTAVDVDGQVLKQAGDLRYLGQIITDDGRCNKEVRG